MPPYCTIFPCVDCLLIDLVCEFCAPLGMFVCVAKTKVMVFNIAFPGPFQWTCGGEQR